MNWANKVPLRGTCHVDCLDQAACIYDALAWSFEQSRVFDPLKRLRGNQTFVTLGVSRCPDSLRNFSERTIVEELA